MVETNGGTKSLACDAPAGAVLTETQDFLFRRRTGFTPHVAVDAASGITIGGYVHEPMPACFGYRTRSIPSDRLLDEVCLLDEVYFPSDRRGLTRHVGLFKEKEVEKHRGPTLPRP